MMTESNDRRHRWYRVRKTVLAFACCMAYGLSRSLIGPSIPDLCDRMNVTTEQLSVTFSVGSGVMIGASVIMGTIVDRFHSHADLILCLVVLNIAVTGAFISLSPNLYVFFLLDGIQLFGDVGINQASNLIIFNTWGEKSNAPITGLHGFWGVGFAISPFIIRPFLGPDKIRNVSSDLQSIGYNDTQTMAGVIDSIDNSSLCDYNTSVIDYNITQRECNITGAPLQESRIEIAYFIVSAISFIISCFAFISYKMGAPPGVKEHLKPKESVKQVYSCDACPGKERRFTVLMLVFFGIYYFWSSAKDGTFFGWLFKFAVDSDMAFKKKEAALLDGAAKFSFVAGRLVASLVAIKIPIQPMLFTMMTMVQLSAIGLATVGLLHKPALYVFTCVFAFFTAPMWPGGLAWTNRYIPVSGTTFIIKYFGAGGSSIIFSYLVGYLFTHQSPNDVMYLVLFAVSCHFCQLILMQVVAHRHGSRFVKEGEQVEGEMNNLITDESDFDESEEPVFVYKANGLQDVT